MNLSAFEHSVPPLLSRLRDAGPIGRTATTRLAHDVEDGTKYVVQRSHPAHLADIQTTARIYGAAGMSVPPQWLVKDGAGSALVTLAIDGAHLAALPDARRAVLVRGLQRNMAIDALVGRASVTGPTGMHVKQSWWGASVRSIIEDGLHHHANGVQRTAAQFGTTVTEIDALRRSASPNLGVFRTVDDTSLAAQILSSADTKPDRHTLLIAAPEALRPLLADRMDNMRRWADTVVAAQGTPRRLPRLAAEALNGAKHPLTHEAESAVKWYTGMGAAMINHDLRTGTVPKQMAHLDAAIASSKLPMDMLLYRVVFDVDHASSAGVGSILRDPGYLSTSMAGSRQHPFLPQRPPELETTLMRIEAPTGTTGLVAGRHSNFSNELEVILPRNTPLEVTGNRTFNNLRIVTARIAADA